ncbi:MAG TPA: hypothetical protein VFT59_04175 [Candidatus Saccharimonadales bacterium]|nr:hypothetical protein [Candidatus Saccharimonadales bacterium]
MQPNHDDDTWQKPSEQPSKAPYAVASDTPETKTPVVSMAPETLPGPDTVAPVYQAAEEAPAAPQDDATNGDVAPVHWQAKEYIHHDKNTIWFIVFGLVVVVLMAAAIFLMDSISFAILVPVMAAALLVYIHRPPRTLDYTLGRQGLHVNDHLYSFSEFKGFGVIRDGEEYSVMLIPVKRFRPGVVVYFPEEAGEAIVDMLGARLPMLKLELDLVDKIIRKLRI